MPVIVKVVLEEFVTMFALEGGFTGVPQKQMPLDIPLAMRRVIARLAREFQLARHLHDHRGQFNASNSVTVLTFEKRNWIEYRSYSHLLLLLPPTFAILYAAGNPKWSGRSIYFFLIFYIAVVLGYIQNR